MTPRGVRGAAAARRPAFGVVHAAWRPRAPGAWRVPAAGPVNLAGNHAHYLDGPVLMGTAPRPVRFLGKREAFVGSAGPFPRGLGQIDGGRGRPDRTPIAAALGVFGAGGVPGIFPEGTRTEGTRTEGTRTEGTRTEGDFAAIRSGLAYLAPRSGTPVVPVAVLGGGDRRGRLITALPPIRGRIDGVFGDPFTPGTGDGRLTRAALDEATAHPGAADRPTEGRQAAHRPLSDTGRAASVPPTHFPTDRGTGLHERPEPPGRAR